MHAYLNTVFQAVLEASKLINQAQERLDELVISEKSQHDYVTQVDKTVERMLVDCIRQAYPQHGILAEEGGQYTQSDEYCWLIDPIDGTTNFIYGIPHFCITLALQIKGKVEHGLVYDPIRQELFSATRGRGCFLNDRKRLRVRDRTHLSGALLGVGAPKRLPNQTSEVADYLAPLAAVYPVAAGIRRYGAAALDLAYVAAGRFDAYWECGLKPWDIAAGTLLVLEAGGLVGDYAGGYDYLANGEVVAANPKLFKQVLQVLHQEAG